MSDDFALGMYMFGKHPSQLAAKEAQRRTDLDLAQYLEQQQERTKQEAMAGKSAEYFFKANPAALKELNLDEPSLANMSAADKYTAMVSYGKAAMAREAQQKRQMDEQTRSVFQDAMARRMNSPLGGQRPDADGLAAAREAIIETAQRTGNPDLLRGLRDVEAGESRNIMPVATKVGGRDLLVNPNSGAFQDITQPTAPKIPEGMSALGAEQDESGNVKIRYGFQKAEGKALTQTEVANLAALNQASSDLDTLENIYKELGPDYGGPVVGRLKSWFMGGQNPNISAINNSVAGATPNVARGVFREVGVLTDADRAEYKKLFPEATDTEQVRSVKLKQLRARIKQGKKEILDTLKAAGRDVREFSSPADAGAKQFDSEEAAKAAGMRPPSKDFEGDVFELYDPNTATYRPARLK